MFDGFKYRFSLLNAVTALFFLTLLVYYFINQSSLSQTGGWGMFGVFGFVVFGLIGFLLDFMLQFLIPSRRLLLWVQLSVLILIAIVIAPFLF